MIAETAFPNPWERRPDLTSLCALRQAEDCGLPYPPDARPKRKSAGSHVGIRSGELHRGHQLQAGLAERILERESGSKREKLR